jgi:hypothetical protein
MLIKKKKKIMKKEIKLGITLSNSVAVERASGFLTRHFETKSFKAGVQRDMSLNVGGGRDGIIKIAYITKIFFQLKLINW